MKPIVHVFIFMLVLLASATVARDRPFVDEPTTDRTDIEDATPWAEGGFVLPPYPEDDDLIEFPVDKPGSPFRYFIDGKHLSVGEDRVVRYTLVIRSSTGGNNVSVEGMRCDAWEIKTYAYDNGRDKLRPLKAPPWKPMKRSTVDQHLLDLREFYFCDIHEHVPYAAKEIVRLLKNTPRREENRGFY